MKKIWIVFVTSLFLSACSIQLSTSGNDLLQEIPSRNDILEEVKPEKEELEKIEKLIKSLGNGDTCFLRGTDWSSLRPSGAYSLIFADNGGYFHSLSTAGEQYATEFGVNAIYQASENTLYITDMYYEPVDVGKILYADDYYLVIDFWIGCIAYEASSDTALMLPHDIVYESAETYIGIYKYTKPRLRISGYGEDTISVFQYTDNPDEVAKDEVWELNLSEDCEFKSIVYSVASDTAEETILEKSDSSKYEDGFFEFNEDGAVSSIVFYEEVWPSEEEKQRYEMAEKLKIFGSDESFLDGTKWERNEGQGFGRSLYLDRFGMYRHSTHGETIDREYFGDMAYYSASDNAYYVVDKQKELMDVGKILYADDYYLVMEFLDACYAFYADKDYDIDFPHEIVHTLAEKYVGIYEYTKPRLRIAEYGDGTVSVFQCTYDSAEVDEAKVWELKLSEDCEFKSVAYSVSSDTAKETILEKSDYESVPSKCADGFFDFNADGEISSVVFYSEVD